jgi:hypothetical protein
MLYHARGGRGQVARDALTRFFFPGLDLHTDKYDPSASIDVEAQALLHFDQQVTVDTRDSQEPERFPPLCVGHVDLLADDTLRLFAYEPYIPRSVLVEYLKTLFGFHLGLYHLRIIKLLPALVRRRGADPICEPKNCPVAPAKTFAHGELSETRDRRAIKARWKRLPAAAIEQRCDLASAEARRVLRLAKAARQLRPHSSQR